MLPAIVNVAVDRSGNARSVGGAVIGPKPAFKLLLFTRMNICCPVNMIVWPRLSVTGCVFANVAQASCCEVVRAAYPVAELEKNPLAIARRPVPMGWTGARRFLTYWPALLCDDTIPA